MKTLALALLAVLVMTLLIRQGSGKHPISRLTGQRSPAEAQRWADYFTLHKDGGGV